jgi:hypothetical protein
VTMGKRLKIRVTENRETVADLNITLNQKREPSLRLDCTESISKYQRGQQECCTVQMFPNFFFFIPLAREPKWLTQLDHDYTFSFNLFSRYMFISHASLQISNYLFTSHIPSFLVCIKPNTQFCTPSSVYGSREMRTEFRWETRRKEKTWKT